MGKRTKDGKSVRKWHVFLFSDVLIMAEKLVGNIYRCHKWMDLRITFIVHSEAVPEAFEVVFPGKSYICIPPDVRETDDWVTCVNDTIDDLLRMDPAAVRVRSAYSFHQADNGFFTVTSAAPSATHDVGEELSAPLQMATDVCRIDPIACLNNNVNRIKSLASSYEELAKKSGNAPIIFWDGEGPPPSKRDIMQRMGRKEGNPFMRLYNRAKRANSKVSQEEPKQITSQSFDNSAKAEAKPRKTTVAVDGHPPFMSPSTRERIAERKFNTVKLSAKEMEQASMRNSDDDDDDPVPSTSSRPAPPVSVRKATAPSPSPSPHERPSTPQKPDRPPPTRVRHHSGDLSSGELTPPKPLEGQSRKSTGDPPTAKLPEPPRRSQPAKPDIPVPPPKAPREIVPPLKSPRDQPSSLSTSQNSAESVTPPVVRPKPGTGGHVDSLPPPPRLRTPSHNP